MATLTKILDSKLETLTFPDKDEDFESFSEPFESRLCLLKLSSVPLDTEHNRNPASNRSQKLPQREKGEQETVRSLAQNKQMVRKKTLSL